MKRTFLAATALSLVLACVLRAADEPPKIKFSDCPAPVQKAFTAESKGAKIESVTKETNDGVTTYWATVTIGDRKYEIGVDEKGTLTDLSLDAGDDGLPLDKCPAAAQKSLQKEASGAKIDQVSKEFRYGVLIYDVIVSIDGRDYEIQVEEDGTLVEKALVITEEEIDLAKAPAAVQKAVKEESRGGKLGSVMRSTGIRGNVYEIEAEIDTKPYVLMISESGLLISKSLDEE
jgi:hypothetical protein